MTDGKMTQAEVVLRYCEEFGSITQKEAWEFGISRLAAVIKQLEKLGRVFIRENVQVSTRYGWTTVTRYRYVA